MSFDSVGSEAEIRPSFTSSPTRSNPKVTKHSSNPGLEDVLETIPSWKRPKSSFRGSKLSRNSNRSDNNN